MEYKKNKRIFVMCLFVFVEIVFSILLFYFSDKYLYSSYNKDLIIIILTACICFLFSFIGSKKLFCVYKTSVVRYFLVGLGVICSSFCVLQIGKCIYAFRYENSREVYKLSSNFSVFEAKKIKNSIDDIFEKDFDDIFSRDIIIDNYYYDEDNGKYILYLADYYKNYKLKFYVDILDDKIFNIYWEYNYDILYFVYEGKKTDDFEFYYAMYILDQVIGNETKKVVKFENFIEDKIKKYFADSTNVIVSYEDLNHNVDKNIFVLKCHAAGMDFYGDVLEKNFEILFNGVSESNTRGVWYYGDSSFDFVNYNINI